MFVSSIANYYIILWVHFSSSNQSCFADSYDAYIHMSHLTISNIQFSNVHDCSSNTMIGVGMGLSC